MALGTKPHPLKIFTTLSFNHHSIIWLPSDSCLNPTADAL